MGEARSRSLRRATGVFFDRPYWRKVREQAWARTWAWIKDNLGTDFLVAGVPGACFGIYQWWTGSTTGTTVMTGLAVAFGSWLLTATVVFIYNYNRAPADIDRARESALADQDQRIRELEQSQIAAKDILSDKATQLLEAVPLSGEIRIQGTAAFGQRAVAIIGSHDGPVVLGDWSFFADAKSSELTEQFLDALDELVKKGFVRDVMDDDTLYRLTSRGWERARQLATKELAEIRAFAADLTKDERALLVILREHQTTQVATKLVVERSGNTTMSDYTGLGPGYTANLYDELKIAIRDPHFLPSQFQTLMERLPMPYLERIPEFMIDNPFIVRVTRIGRRYLRDLEILQHMPDGYIDGAH